MIYNKNQYNQGVGKYKVLSSTAGVGSIIPTTWGGFIMPLSVNNWPMIRSFTNQITTRPDDDLTRIAEDAKCILVSDQRFVNYLRSIQQLPNLRALISVPHLNLSDYNYCDYQSHPLFKKWAMTHKGQRLSGEPDTPEGNRRYVNRFLNENGDTLTIPAIVFPRWFTSSFGGRELMPIKDWYEKWQNDTAQQSDFLFVPPVEARRDNNNQIINRRERNNRRGRRDNRNVREVPKGFPLQQVQMVLICPNGHISDIPWDKYFAIKLAAQGRHLTGDDYRDLFDVNSNTCNNNQAHKLQWLPNISNPESYGTLKCTCCGGSVSLEGIMNIRPRCSGEKPWVGDPQTERNAREDCNQFMRWALVTSNSVYYAESFNSLYVPQDLLGNQLNENLNTVLSVLREKHNNWLDNAQNGIDFFDNYLFPTIIRDEVDDYNDENDDEDAIDCNIEIVQSVINAFRGRVQADDLAKIHRKIYKRLSKKYDAVTGNESIESICVRNIAEVNNIQISIEDAEAVLRIFEQGPQQDMTPEKYRYDEYKIFMERDTYQDEEGKYLSFNDVDLSQMTDERVRSYFSKIKQFTNLAISTTQLQFSRASQEDTDDNQGQQRNEPINQMIFDCKRDEVRALPANQNFGEGLFFSLNENLVYDYCCRMDENGWYNNITAGDLGHKLLSQMEQYGKAKFYLLHTFSHIIMKELEFTCGYPTASLQERLYYSDRMCGVLIYTADGSEGSMGGLVAQGTPITLEKIILKALERAMDCSSDPLCWENSDGLNKAACFSCAMVSETSCEHFNMGLDRRALVDPKFGFFNDLLYQNVQH
jgi:hypothetical protein